MNCRKFFCRNFQEVFDEYDAGFIEEQHCGCPECELKRVDMDLPRCIDKSCEGCKNLASGKKIRNIHGELLKWKSI